MVRLRSACCCSKVRPRNLRPVAMRQRRDDFTASKVFFLVVAMDKEGWSYYAQSRIPLQEIDGIKSGFPPHVGQVLEVPADQILDAGHGAHSHMPRVIVKTKRHDLLREVGLGELFDF